MPFIILAVATTLTIAGGAALGCYLYRKRQRQRRKTVEILSTFTYKPVATSEDVCAAYV